MGRVKGDLEVLGIANLLQILTMNRCEGYLTLSMDDQKKVIQFGPSGIRLLSGARRVSPLGEILLRTRKITRPQLVEILLEQPKSGMPLGEFVIRRGILTKDVIDNALREQVSDEIYDLFTWTHGTFDYMGVKDGTPPREEGLLASVVLDGNVMSITLEAARRVDELARIQSVIPDERLIPERLELPVALDDPGLDRDALEEVLPLVDGERSVAEIIEESLYPRFTVLIILYALAQRGVIKIRDAGADEGPKTVMGMRAFRPDERPAGATHTVLLLSDLPTFRTALSMCIRNSGIDVIEGRSSAELTELLAGQIVSAIVLDVPIETEDGLALCVRLRETTRVPFIVLAGNGSKQAVSNAIQSGARYVLLKPIKEDLLIQRIGMMIQPDPAPAKAAAQGDAKEDQGTGSGWLDLT